MILAKLDETIFLEKNTIVFAVLTFWLEEALDIFNHCITLSNCISLALANKDMSYAKHR
jgi:hypothetical protein